MYPKIAGGSCEKAEGTKLPLLRAKDFRMVARYVPATFSQLPILMLFLAALAIVSGQAPKTIPPAVQAKGFILVDDSGRKRGEWNLDAAGQPSLKFYDEHGRVIWDSMPGVHVLPLSR